MCEALASILMGSLVVPLKLKLRFSSSISNSESYKSWYKKRLLSDEATPSVIELYTSTVESGDKNNRHTWHRGLRKWAFQILFADDMEQTNDRLRFAAKNLRWPKTI